MALIRPDAKQLTEYQFEYDLLPLHHYTFKDMDGRERGKSPVDKDWRQKRYSFDDMLNHMKRHGRNVGVLLSAEQLVLDYDPRNIEKGKDLQAFCRLVGLDPSTCPTVKTGSGGLHLYMKKPSGVKLVDSLKDFPGIEFKSLGRQVVAAGSIHPNGKQYSWDSGRPSPGSEPDAPTKLILLATRPDRVIDTDAGELSPETLARNLEQLNAEDYKSHDEWFTIMQACHYATAGEGRQEFIDWSTSDPEFQDHGVVIGRRWDSLHTEKSDSPVTEKTLYKEILKAGGEVLYAEAAEDFPEDDTSIAAREEQAANPIARTRQGRINKTAEGMPALSRGDVKELTQLNRLYWVVDMRGTSVVMREHRVSSLRLPGKTRVEPVYYTFDNFAKLYKNKKVLKANAKGEDVEEDMGQAWLEWRGRRTYYDLVCDPSPDRKDDPETYNMFKGWGVEPSKGDWSLMRDHLREVVCDGNGEHFDYFLKWIAMLFQKPHILPKVAIIMQGGKGTGKSMVGDAILTLVGQHGQYASNKKHVTDRFNGHLQDCIFLFADEAFYAGDKDAEADLKSLITQESRMYEHKYKSPQVGQSLMHMMMASNMDWAVHATSDERRYAIFRVSDKRQGDKAYFRSMWKQLTEEGGFEAMLYELLIEVDIEDFDPTESIPQTEALATVKLYSMNAFELWWQDILEQGSFDGDLTGANWEDDPILIPIERMADLYGEYKQNTHRAGPFAVPQMLGIAIGKLIDKGHLVRNLRRRPPDDYPHMLKTNTQGLVPCIEVPELGICREMFNARFGTELGKGALD